MRIIAGSARGRSFEAPAGRNTRPTLARVKEAMFGMIQFDIEGRYALDLFAGSGNLGLEALSRGADSVVFCDSERGTAKLIEKNIKHLGFENSARVFCCDCFALLKQLSFEERRFSLIFLDPPYDAGLTEKVLAALSEYDLIENGCIILAEHSWKLPLSVDLPGFVCRDPRKYGDAAITYIRFSKEEI